MDRQALSAFLLLSIGFASCSSPYAAKFYAEHPIPQHPISPEVAVFLTVEPADILSYVVARNLCPKRVGSFLDKTVKLALMKKLALKGPNIALAIASMLPDLYRDALSPRAMSYASVKAAMATAIANAYSLGIDCSAIERASMLYYNYGILDYERDVCSGKSTLKEVLDILKSAKRARGIEGVEEIKINPPNVKLRKGKAPLCHPCLQEIIKKAEEENLPIKDLLENATLDIMFGCPIKYKVGGKEAILSEIVNDTYYFFVGDEEKPLLIVKRDKAGIEIENIGNEEFSGHIPFDGKEISVDLKPREKKRVETKSSRIFEMILAGVAIVLIWRWKNEEN